MSLFITFEGGEGSGKTYQTRTLYRRLTMLAIPALLIQEPGGTPFGRKIARLLKWSKDNDISPLTELLMFNASRAQLVQSVIQPGLKEGKVIICDRFSDSTIAYQGYGRGLDLKTVEAINNIATQGLKPDLTFLMDLPVEQGFNRKKDRERDRFEQEALDFHKRVREGYLKLAAKEPERWVVIEAGQSRQKISEIIWQRISLLLAKQD